MINKEKLYKEKIRKFNKERYFKMIPSNLLKSMDEPFLDQEYKIDLMEEEISDNGILSPVTVAKRRDGTYIIIDGVRRVKALKRILKNEKVPCYVIKNDDLSMRELRLLSLAANRVKRPERTDLSILYAKELLKLHGSGAYNKSDLPEAYAQLTGKTPRQGRKYIRIVEKGSPKVVKKVSDGEMPVNVAASIVNKSVKEQEKLLKEYEKLPRGEKKYFAKTIKESECATAKEAHEAKVTDNITIATNSLKFLLSEKSDLKQEEIQFLLSLCSAFILKYQV